MPRTLGPVQQRQLDQQNSQQNNQPFYLNNQLPMFLVHNQNHPQKYQNLDQDIAKCKKLIESLCDNQIKTKQNLEQIQTLVQQQKDLSKGMGYFSAKNLVFLQYLMLLKLYQLFRINGRSLTSGNGLQLYKRLAYLKTLLLKLSPVEKKLEYQKTKILKHSDKAVVTKQHKKQESQQEQDDENDQQKIEEQQNQQEEIQNQVQEEDQMAFKPRPNALMNIKKERQIKLAKNDKYEAPKISSNLSKQDKFKQRLQRQKQIKKLGLIRRLQSDLIDDDRAEQRFLGDEINEKFKRKFQQKLNYEQDAFIRLPDTKKDKFYMKQMVRNSMRKNQLDEDYKQVQMVRKLFEQQNVMQNKILNEKRKNSSQNTKGNKKQAARNDNQKIKKIKKFNKN